MFVGTVVLSPIMRLFAISSALALVAATHVTPNIDMNLQRAVDGGNSAPFVHPGVFVDGPRLKFVATKVAAKAEPWNAAYSALTRHPLATRTSPTPHATVECGPYSTPNVGCSDELGDAMAAYANALMWAVTNDKSKADRAIKFMDAWSPTIKSHTNSNAPLQAAWAATSWVRAAEIMRYTDAGWSSTSITAFENMLRTVYLPIVKNGSRNPNNWELGASLRYYYSFL